MEKETEYHKVQTGEQQNQKAKHS